MSINPKAVIVDISHQIAPQGIVQAADMLKSAYRWFPEGTIHLSVVDPGVGSGRAIVAARYAGHTFVAPDNGLLGRLWRDRAPKHIVRVENSRLYLHPVSATFHGRDIFAPVAAHLSLGNDLNTLGPAVDASELVAIDGGDAVWNEEQDLISGQVTSVDRFGNLLTNIDAALIERFGAGHPGRKLLVQAGSAEIDGITKTYAEVAEASLIALVGSRDRLEIAINCGNAARRLHAGVGLGVVVRAAR